MSFKKLLLVPLAAGGLTLAAGLSAAGELDGHPKGPVMAGGKGGMSGMDGKSGMGGMGGQGMGMGMGPGGMGMDFGPGMRMHMGDLMGDCQMGGMGGMSSMGMGGMTGMAGDMRADVLKSQLDITPAQMAAFDAYVDAVGKHQARMRAMHETMMQTRNTGTAPERLERRIAAMESHAAALKDLKGPLATLYDALTDDQKRKADGALFGCSR